MKCPIWFNTCSFFFVFFSAPSVVQNVWIGNTTRVKSSFLEPIVVPKANISEMYTGFVNHTAEFLFDFEYSEKQVKMFL